MRDLGPGTRLLVVPDSKFKTIVVRVEFRSDLDGAATARNVIAAVLNRGTRRLPDLRAINRRLDELYGAILGSDVDKIADWQINSFTLSAVSERFLPGGVTVLPEAISLLREALFEPAREDGGFVGAYVESEKENLARALEAQLNDKARYASLRLLETMFPGEPYGRNPAGRKEDLPAMDRESLWRCYERWIAEAQVDIVVGGAIEPARAIELLGGFGDRRRGGAPLLAAGRLPPAGPAREIVEELDVAQARLCMGFRHGAVIGSERLAACQVACGLLGGFPHAKLFMRVRERESLAYSIGASYDEAKGVLFISAGIDPGVYERVRDLILELIGEVARGEFTAEDLAATKLGLTRRLATSGDSVVATLEQAYLWSLFGREFSAPALIGAIERVGPADVCAEAAAWSLDTIYLLRGRK